MKNYILFAALFISSNLFAIDRFVDPTLSSGNGTTYFTTITSAVNAALNGDRILIVTGTYNEPTLTISKSLTLLSQTVGTMVNFNGNIVISGFAGMKLEILGFNLGIYSISSNAISSGSATNRAKVSIIDSKMTNLSVDADYYELNCARCSIANATIFRYGNFVVSRTNSLSVYDEPNQNYTESKILIVSDTIDSRIEFRNDNYPVTIANCLLNELYFMKWNNNLSNTNYIRNNSFKDGANLLLADAPPAYNFEFSSNEFQGAIYFQSAQDCRRAFYDGNVCGACGCPLFSLTFSIFPSPSVSGFFKWTYNGIDLPCTIPTGSQPLVLTKIIGTTGTNTNAGNPNHDYYDTDLTINDRGRTGGPYSILNYNPTINPSNGKAFIFDLEMPTDIFTGQQVDIKAKGYHKN